MTDINDKPEVSTPEIPDGSTPTVSTPAIPQPSDGDLNGDAVPDWLIPSRVYDVLKWLAVLVLPALSVLIAALGPVWGFGPLATQLATTVNAVNLFLGAVIGASAIKAASAK